MDPGTGPGVQVNQEGDWESRSSRSGTRSPGEPGGKSGVQAALEVQEVVAADITEAFEKGQVK